MKRLLAVLILGCSCGFAWWFLTAWRQTHRPIEAWERTRYATAEEWLEYYVRNADEETGWVRLPAATDAESYTSQVDPAKLGMLDAKVCGECHAERYQEFVQTAHHKTSQIPTSDTLLAPFGEQVRLETSDPRLWFQMEQQGDAFFQAVVVQDGAESYQHRQQIDLVTGSGNHGQTYLYWHQDQLLQLPASYFTELGRWVNSPGVYREGTADFGRPINPRCLDCHATFFAHAPGSENRYDASKSVLGVSCVRCHGPGWAHVQYHRQHPEEKEAHFIVHPGELSRDRANEVCAQCHSGAGDPLRPAFSYRPGEPIGDYLRLDMSGHTPHNQDPHAANQLARLRQSRCFQESDSMTCATCHNPHRVERGDMRLFAERCISCHQVDQCGMHDDLGQVISDHCVACHLPSKRDEQSAMQTRQGAVLALLRDHKIAIYPEESETVRERLEADRAVE